MTKLKARCIDLIFALLPVLIVLAALIGCAQLQSASQAAYNVVPDGRYEATFEYDAPAGGAAYKGGVAYTKDAAASAKAGHDVLAAEQGAPAAAPKRIHLRRADTAATSSSSSSSAGTPPIWSPSTADVAPVRSQVVPDSVIQGLKNLGGAGLLLLVLYLHFALRPIGVELLAHARATSKKLGVTDDEIAGAKVKVAAIVPDFSFLASLGSAAGQPPSPPPANPSPSTAPAAGPPSPTS